MANTFRVFIIREMLFAIVNLYAKFEVSSFSRSVTNVLAEMNKLYGRRVRPTRYAPIRVQQTNFTGLCS